VAAGYKISTQGCRHDYENNVIVFLDVKRGWNTKEWTFAREIKEF